MAYEDVKILLHGRNRKKFSNNTYLYTDEDWDGSEQIVMKLHEHPIAIFTKNYVALSACNWYTNTTKDRLNVALQIARTPLCVFQKHFRWYIRNHERNTDYLFFTGIKVNYDGTIRI